MTSPGTFITVFACCVKHCARPARLFCLERWNARRWCECWNACWALLCWARCWTACWVTFGNVEIAFAVAVSEHVIGIGDMFNIPAKYLIKRCGSLEHLVHSVDRADVPCRDVLVERFVVAEHTQHTRDRADIPATDVWIAPIVPWSTIPSESKKELHVAHAGRVPGRDVTVRFLRRLLVGAPGVHRLPDVVIIHNITAYSTPRSCRMKTFI
mmetsp:Transcript_40442/g.92902  ORF Transcript_40442/g.92902 Transcript_40442/m.92902 type:complete len:212 (-) Transcript_40442:142-777(-)